MQDVLKVAVLETAGHQWEVHAPDPDDSKVMVRVEGVMFRKLCDAVAYADGRGWHVNSIFYWQP